MDRAEACKRDTYRKANPDAPGTWKHDLHSTVKQTLASRLAPSSSSSRPTLLARISGRQGKELLHGDSAPRLHGFDERPPVNPTRPNSGLELLPGGNGRPKRGAVRGVGVAEPGSRSLLDTALGRNGGAVRQEVRRPVPVMQGNQVENVSIMGAARGTTWVKVEHLALGTTAEDVVVGNSPFMTFGSELI